MATTEKSNKIIWTADCIASYLGISKNKFYVLVKAGLPAVVIDGTWCAHTDNLDAFFRSNTGKIMTNIPPDAK
jgi:hypothetical protein